MRQWFSGDAVSLGIFKVCRTDVRMPANLVPESTTIWRGRPTVQTRLSIMAWVMVRALSSNQMKPMMTKPVRKSIIVRTLMFPCLSGKSPGDQTSR